MTKKPGRVKLICVVCEKEFSTHSSNREKCHKCLPKCTERHYFFEVPKTKENEEGLRKAGKDGKKAGKKTQKVE